MSNNSGKVCIGKRLAIALWEKLERDVKCVLDGEFLRWHHHGELCVDVGICPSIYSAIATSLSLPQTTIIVNQCEAQ